MHTVGIIAEYNPFHTGHEYHLKKAKELSDADYAVVVMSPDFVQRGEPAIFDKYTRAEMALRSGADVVIELPICYATGSAEYFAEGAVRMLDALGVVDALSFGTEDPSGEGTPFIRLASFLLDEPEGFQELLRDGLRRGLTWPQARAAAVSEYFQASQSNTGKEISAPQSDTGKEISALQSNAGKEISALQSDIEKKIPALLSSPNNILGVEYCKALRKIGSPISPIPLSRKGSQYSDLTVDGEYCSASALRRVIRTGTDTQNRVNPNPQNFPEPGARNRSEPDTKNCPHPGMPNYPSADAPQDPLYSYIPAGCAGLFAAARQAPIFADDLLPFLTQKLIYAENPGRPAQVCPDEILDISSDFSERIMGLRFSCIGKSFDETVTLLKTRQITETHIRRALLHLILDIRKADMESYQKNGYLFYAHLLGFRRESAPLLHEIKKRSALPLISKAAHASKSLSGTGLSMWNQDAAASHLYRSLMAARYGIPFRTEYEISPIVL
ncbi:MAG: nucleotidyltransferase family protein [Lachnospiraceae bacterium]|nr:nucleotidyltransferase family protein [Lachnospiraceae bacterium]